MGSEETPSTGHPDGAEPESLRVVRLLEKYFFARTDRVAIRAGNGKPVPVEPPRELADLLRTHVLGEDTSPVVVRQHTRGGGEAVTRGRYRVGSYSTRPDGSVRWLCLDFDGPGHATALADPETAARRTQAAFAQQGIPSYLECSGSGKGWHLWTFFAEPIPARSARSLAFELLPNDIGLASGGLADPARGRGIEVFPKQDEIDAEGLGNMVWLPWWSDAEPGGNLFYEPAADGALVATCPSDFQTVGAAALLRILGGGSRGGGGQAAAKREKRKRSEDARESSTAWTAWRQKALAALRLESVYGLWLTGERSGEGWLECRDPSSPSGDRSPSAGVATGEAAAERGAFHSFISGETISVFDFLIRHGGVPTLQEALRRVSELSGLALPKVKASEAEPASEGDEETRDPRLPTIRVNQRQLKYTVRDGWNAIIRRNTRPSLYRRLGEFVRLVDHEEEPPSVEPMDEIAVFSELAEAANWVKRTDSDDLIDVFPPKELSRIMARQPDRRLPNIRKIVTTPVFGRDGVLISEGGYHSRERLWYEPPVDFELPPIPAHPSPEEVAVARQTLLVDLLGDFPFVGDADRAHAVAALLLHFVRPIVSYRTPIHLIEAPAAGTGKGFVASAVHILATGSPSDGMTLPTTEEEVKKVFTSELLADRPVMFFDNADDTQTLHSPALASITTSLVWKDRILGTNKTVRLPNLATWILTGNNVALSNELTRRCVRIRMDAGVENPAERPTEIFRHQNFEEWAVSERPKLVAACLTLIQAWIAAGQPAFTERTHGSFEQWGKVLGGILAVAGIPGFLGNVAELRANADTGGDELREFVQEWWAAFESGPKQVAELNTFCDTNDLMGLSRGDGGPRSQQTKLGAALHRAHDRIFGRVRIKRFRRTGSFRGRTWYALEAAGTNDPEQASIPGIDLREGPRQPSVDRRSLAGGSEGDEIDLTRFDRWCQEDGWGQ